MLLKIKQARRNSRPALAKGAVEDADETIKARQQQIELQRRVGMSRSMRDIRLFALRGQLFRLRLGIAQPFLINDNPQHIDANLALAR